MFKEGNLPSPKRIEFQLRRYYTTNYLLSLDFGNCLV